MSCILDQTNHPASIRKCLHELFEEQVELVPDAFAVVFENDGLTYLQLNARANQLARYLRARGVGPETLVGVYLERSVDMIVCLLAILKAGGAYLPLDPVYPAERLAFMLADAQASLLLTHEALLKNVALPELSIIALDAQSSLIASETADNLDSRNNPDNLAYVIYTSGSTGRPKGVCISHASVARLVNSCQDIFKFSAADVWTVVHSFAFDFSVWEIFGALLSGSRLIVVPLFVTRSPADFHRLLIEHQVTILSQTPSATRQLHDLRSSIVEPDKMSLRLFICGGEALPATLAADLLSWDVPLWNFYGPTECTVWATLTPVLPDQLQGATAPIGFPLAGLQTWILDDKFAPVTPGTAGELYLGGPQLARGYLHRPELTATRFIPDCFSSEPGARLYRTGDLARALPGGSIEHLGRLDHQVKVRGFRIELEEIEAAIARHQLVSETVVTVHEDASGEKRLVAYLVSRGSDSGVESAPGLADGRISDWMEIWDETYKQSPAQADPTFNIIGWNSSYTGLPYDAGEMQEWVDETVTRIQTLKPRRVLEIGCGSGLLLFRLAPGCESYVGTDASATAQSKLREQLDVSPAQLSQVTLAHRPADDFMGFAAKSFDTVVINSVAQYFPDVAYLLRVLEGAVRVTRDGGAIFIGDLRWLELLPVFHTSVQLAHAPNALPASELRRRINRSVLCDEQLAISPGFFAALQREVPRIARIEFQLKRGCAQNETTKFRYDACVRIGSESQASLFVESRDWPTQPGSIDEVREWLLDSDSQGGASGLRLTHVPNGRLWREAAAVELLDHESGSVADLRAKLRATKPSGVDPEGWWRLGDELGYAVAVQPATDKTGSYDVVFTRRQLLDHSGSVSATAAPGIAVEWQRYASDPLQGIFTRRFVPQLRSFLRVSLPEYMVPSSFVLLDALPLTSNAKIDRGALPEPDSARPLLDEDFVAPRNSVEATLVEIWSAVLKLDRVGVADNFIELGGHSVMATQIVARVRDVFGIELPLRTIFETPTIAAMAQTIAELADDATMAVELPRNVSPTLAGRPRSAVAANQQRLSLSFAQRRMWFLEQLVPGTPVYNLPTKVRLPAIDPGILEHCLNEIARRHQTLRTTITVSCGEPYQVIGPACERALPIEDLSRLPEAEAHRAETQLARTEAAALFDLEHGPLWRARLVKLSPERFVLLVTMHHIVSDNWSIILFFEELSALYAAFTSGGDSSLPELPAQYADYAVWQQEQLTEKQLASQLAFWQEQLTGAPMVLELPADFPRPEVISFRAARASLTLPSTLVRALKMLGQREGATTFMSLLAVFNLLLYRLTDQDDILIGSPIANRVRTETESMIGLFLNNLVLRTRLAAETSFRELLTQVRETALAAFANQDVPFEKLVEVLQQQRDLSRTPLFQVFFNLFDAADNQIDFAGEKIEVFSPIEAWSQFDLTLYAAEKADTIELTLAFNADLFREERMTEMLGQLSGLLEQVIAEPDQPLACYSLLSARSGQLSHNPAVALEMPEYQPITDLFFAQARAQPTATALVKGSAFWSYQELAQQAAAIAAALLRAGVQKGEVVAVSGPPSFGLIAAMLGVLSSGSVLLTLDQSLPLERRLLLIEQSAAKHLIQIGVSPETLAPLSSLVIRVDELDGYVAGSAANNLSAALPALAGEDPAYVFFTSGTTGIPKGVLGCHRGLSHFLNWQREEFKVSSADRAAQLTGLSFDVVLRDIFLPLTSGASLHLPDDPADIASIRILDWLDRENITLLHTVPSLAQLWLREAGAGRRLASLRCVFFAGEPLTDSLVRRWRDSVSAQATLVNLYGPTETTLAKCFYVIPQEPLFGVQPVGRPLPQTQALVLNQRNLLCGIGEPGEIVIRTPFRTLGYLNASAEQAARFIPNPFTEAAGDLLYRTGDRGRFRPDGELEILGRLDDQIKVRGVRVEPAEVAAILARHSAVQSCFVGVHKDSRDQTALVAYFVSNVELSSNDLRSYLTRQLPAAMVPSWFISLPELPLTVNGKVDRQALPKPDQSLLDLPREFVGPRNATEQIIADVWTEVLSVERISVVSNFFELGGHSLLATQIVSRLREAFQIEIPLSSIFESPTVAGLSLLIVEAQARGTDGRAAAIKVLPRRSRPPVKQQS